MRKGVWLERAIKPSLSRLIMSCRYYGISYLTKCVFKCTIIPTLKSELVLIAVADWVCDLAANSA